jgi:hypothetical protein
MSAVVTSLTRIYFLTDGIHEQEKMEPDNVERPSYDFDPGAANGAICGGPRGFNDHGQELLAE